MSSANRQKGAEYYLGLNYSVELRALKPEEGGGYIATIPLLGRHTFVGDGDTPLEALEALEELRKQLIPILIAQGVELPEPDPDPEAVAEADQYSGKLLLRIPKDLHRQLAVSSKRNGCSINKLATQLLSANLAYLEIVEQLRPLLMTASRHYLPRDIAADPMPGSAVFQAKSQQRAQRWVIQDQYSGATPSTHSALGAPDRFRAIEELMGACERNYVRVG